MAHGSKYYATFYDDEKSILYRVELQLKDYASTEYGISVFGTEPLNWKSRGSRADIEDDDIVIQGEEVIFTIFSTVQDNNKYNELLDSDYKDWKLVIYKDAVKYWEGYVKPENVYRDYWDTVGYFIVLSATDALADLKNIDYPDISGDVSILSAIKTCINQIDIPLDFKIQLGTWETILGAVDSCALSDTDINVARFINDKDGAIFNTNCYEVIEEILRPYNVILIQEDGFYKITKRHEIDSYVYTFDYATLTEQSRLSSDLEVDISSGYDITNKGQLSRMVPYKKVDMIFQNRNLGESLLDDPTFDVGISEWTKADIYLLTSPGDYMQAYLWDGNNGGLDTYAYTKDLPLAPTASGLVLHVDLKIRLHSITGNSSSQNQGAYTIKVIRDNAGVPEELPVTGNMVGFLDEGADYISVLGETTVTVTDDYYLEIWFHYFSTIVHGVYTTAYYHVDDVYLTTTVGDDSDVTYDRLITATNTPSAAITPTERKVFFGDTIQQNDVGAYKDGGVLTSSWNRYDETDEVELHDLYLQTILNDYANYKNFLSLTIHDPNDTLKFNSVILLDSKNYIFIGFEKNLKTNIITCKIVEILVADATVAYNRQSLTTVDGKTSSGGTTVIQGEGSVGTLDAVTSLGPTTTNAIQVGNMTAQDVIANAAKAFKIGNWEIKLSTNDLIFVYNSTTVAKLSTVGYWSTEDDQESEVSL